MTLIFKKPHPILFKIIRILELLSQAVKEARRDLELIIVIHLLLLNLYAVVYDCLRQNHLDILPRYIFTNATVPGAYTLDGEQIFNYHRFIRL